MKKLLTKILFLVLIVLPLILVYGSGLFTGHQLKGETVQADFLDSDNRIEILFFGYVDCPSVCPSSMAKMASVIDQIDTGQVGFNFINIVESEQHISTKEYSTEFHQDLNSVDLSPQKLRDLMKKLSVRIRPSIRDSKELMHTDHFYVLKSFGDEWKVQTVLSNQVNPNTLLKTIRNL